MAGYQPSHQDLHCLPFCFDFQLTPLFAAEDMSKFKDRSIQCKISEVKELTLSPYWLVQIPMQTVQIQMKWLIMSHFIRIYTVCHTVYDHWLTPYLQGMDVSKFKDGTARFRNPVMKGFNLKKVVHSLILFLGNHWRTPHHWLDH